MPQPDVSSPTNRHATEEDFGVDNTPFFKNPDVFLDFTRDVFATNPLHLPGLHDQSDSEDDTCGYDLPQGNEMDAKQAPLPVVVTEPE